MKSRILLDANAILNAAFVAPSWSRLAVNAALNAQTSICVGTGTLQEAHGIAARMAQDLGKRSDPRPVLDAYLRGIGAMHFVAETGTDIPPEVPRHDALVYREAQTCGAEILTSDAELWLACKKIRSPAVLPLELIRRYNGVALANTIFGVIPTRDSGSIFVRAYPGPWASLRTPQRFTLVHFPAGVIWLYYETAERKWIAELTGYKRLQVATEITDGMLQTVGLSWKFGEQITLRVADAEHPHVVEMRAPLPNDVEGRVQIGGHPSGQHYWNGPIYVCVNDDRPIGKDAWREFKQDRELTPNPFDNDRLWMFMAHVLR